MNAWALHMVAYIGAAVQINSDLRACYHLMSSLATVLLRDTVIHFHLMTMHYCVTQRCLRR
jgi:hypothetical protein